MDGGDNDNGYADEQFEGEGIYDESLSGLGSWDLGLGTWVFGLGSLIFVLCTLCFVLCTLLFSLLGEI